jgi:hypothetical protein
MESKDLIKMNLGACRGMTIGLIADMADAPLTFPTAKGGSHPLWVLGHLALSESMFLHDWILGDTNPLAEWQGMFGGGTEPSDNADDYPSFEEVMEKSNEVNAQLMAKLDSYSEEDLDQPSKAPEEMSKSFGTLRQVFCMAGIHWMMHRGNVADARRSAGRPPMMK